MISSSKNNQVFIWEIITGELIHEFKDLSSYLVEAFVIGSNILLVF